jgi:membrane protein YqaA with SNARE-associated domain
VPAFGFFLSWWGTFLLAVLDTSMVFVLPFGIDAVVIYLAARDEDLFWLYPLVATAGSLTGAAATYWLGRKLGDAGLSRVVSERRLEGIRRRVRERGAAAMGLSALVPPPFPVKPFVLTCGALGVNRWVFFSTFGALRLVRFGAEAGLARRYGDSVLAVLQSDWFQTVVIAIIVVAIAGTTVSALMLWRKAREATA